MILLGACFTNLWKIIFSFYSLAVIMFYIFWTLYRSCLSVKWELGYWYASKHTCIDWIEKIHINRYMSYIFFLSSKGPYMSNICSFLLQFLSPSISEESSHDNIWKEDIKSTVNDILNTESHGQFTRYWFKSAFPVSFFLNEMHSLFLNMCPNIL